jgi:hypothetical protein
MGYNESSSFRVCEFFIVGSDRRILIAEEYNKIEVLAIDFNNI